MPHAKEFFQELHDAGYVIFSKEANFPNRAGGVEFAFVKLSTDFFVNETVYTTLNDRQRNVLPFNEPRRTSAVLSLPSDMP